ncbi:proteinase inhibitor I78 [Streptomyces sp. NBC_01216]|uniref:proteinase inhibitor I78 n=1 Tax=unclassified Streptomyces TaxID=2593676 RepID=UPI002E1468AB|nr:proteinase inhibitor I78 [Streptomyces sp. NBC_01216]
MTPEPDFSAPPEDDAPDAYVGLARERAERLAGLRGWSVVRSVPAGSIITLEYLEGRINFEVDGGTVTRCWLG